MLAVAGCAQVDPYTRADMWQPSGDNDRNLAAMVDHPADLVRGHGDNTPQPQLATDAVSRLLAGTPTPLPSLSADTAPGAGTSSASAPAPAPAPATGPAAAPASN